MTKNLIVAMGMVLAITPWTAQSADVANGERINRKCALCHGIYGQGTPGRLSPRLAGFPKWYLEKSTKEYRDGQRMNPLMVDTSGLSTMTDDDVEDVAAYLASLEIGPDRRFDVVMPPLGNPAEGAQLFDDDCKVCHAKDGFGKASKEAPPLAGQHHEYLFSTMKLFQAKVRIHANEQDDDTFDDYTDAQLLNLLSYLSSLDDAKIRADYRFFPPTIAPTQVAAARERAAKRKDGGLQISDIKQTVAQMEIKEGVSIDDAIQAMRSKAVELNLRLVGEQFVSKELESRGVETPYLAILQFCDPMDARTMIINNPIFASYMPCRIAVVQDQNKKPWLMMLNLDMLINSELLPKEVIETAIRVNQNMLDIMVAGATGEF